MRIIKIICYLNAYYYILLNLCLLFAGMIILLSFTGELAEIINNIILIISILCGLFIII